MTSVADLPPLPASLSAALAAGMVAPPGLPCTSTAGDEPTYSNLPPPPPVSRASPAGGGAAAVVGYQRRDRAGSSGSVGRRAAPAAPLPRTASTTSAGSASRRSSQLENQLDRLRQQMSELRQLDMSLFYQLWSLNDAILELKQAIRSPSWDNGYDGSADEEEGPRRQFAGLSSSSSSLEYGNI